jgi:hypothetical protein
MKSATTFLKIAAAFALAAFIFAIANPKTVHGIVSTLVTVANTPSSPVPVQPVPARQVVAADCFPQITNGNFGGSCFLNDPSSGNPYTVPAGKRLVVDTTSVFCSVPSGQNILNPALFSNVGGSPNFTGFRTAFEGPNGNADSYTLAQNGIAYADAGTSLDFQILKNSTSGSAGCGVWMQGHLEDIQ